MKNKFKATIVETPTLLTIKKTRAASRRGAARCTVQEHTRVCPINLPPSLLIYEHLASVELAAHYASTTPLSPHHKDAARRAVQLLNETFAL